MTSWRWNASGTDCTTRPTFFSGARPEAEARERAHFWVRGTQLRHGLLICIEALRGLRLRSVLSLRLGDSIWRDPEDGLWHLRLLPEGVKNHRYVEGALTRILALWIDRYVEVERQEMLRGAVTDAFWVVIRRIFESYAAGVSPRAIARQLNADAVPGPRGGSWTASLLLGGAGRETGLLRNRLYVGERVWNRQKWVKDPSTGRRVARPNPRQAWVVSAVPELAILEREVWDRARARLEASRQVVTAPAGNDSGGDKPRAVSRGTALSSVRRPRWPLAGLVRCGVCNGPMTVVGSGGRLGCANHVERGTCENHRAVARDAVMRRVMVGLKERLLVPELVEEFVRGYVAEVNATNRERGSRRASLQGEASKLDRQIRNLLELLKEGHGGPAMAAELRELERRRETLRAEMAAAETPEPVPDLHPNMPALYRRRVQALEEALADPTTAGVAAEALRALVDAILVFPGERRGEVTLSLRGDLAALLHGTLAEEGTNGPGGLNAKTPAIQWDGGRFGEVLGTLDAGTGFGLWRTAVRYRDRTELGVDGPKSLTHPGLA